MDGSEITRRGFIAGCSALGATVMSACSQGAGSPQAKATDNKADLVLCGGEIQTMKTDDEVVSAVAAADGEIVFVGDDEGVQKYIGKDTKVIDLDGLYVLPGFIDGHNHGASHQLEKKFDLYLNETAPNQASYQKVMKDYREKYPDKKYILGHGLNLNAFENNSPAHGFIDEIIDDACVFIQDMSVHGCLLNKKAMDEIGLTKDTKAPDGGTIYTDGNGEPTGYLSDCFSLTAPLFAKVTHDAAQEKAAFKEFMKEMNSYGLTALQVPGGGFEDGLDIIREFAKSGKMTMRVSLGQFVDDLNADGAKKIVKVFDKNQSYNSDWCKVTLAKAIIDGVPEGKSALLIDPYDSAAGMPADYRGPVSATQDELNEMTAIIDKAGYQVEFHAMGDGAVNMALNAFEYALKHNGKRDARHQIAHATLMKDEDIPRMGDLNVIGAMQPMWFYYDPFFSPLEEKVFGKARFAKEYRIKDMLDAGIVMTGSIDYPITLEARPLTGIQAGATQCSPFDGEEDSADYLRNPDQAVTVLDMVKMYTVNGAFALEMDKQIGTIEVGKKADFVVLGQNILSCDVKDVANTGVLYTISDGRVVYTGKDKSVKAKPIQGA